MNEPGTNSYFTVVAGVSGGPTVVPLRDGVLGAPPQRGTIRNVRVVRTATGIPPGTSVTLNIREVAGSRLRFSSTDPLPGTIDITASPAPQYFGALVLEVINDAGGTGDAYNVVVDISGPE